MQRVGQAFPEYGFAQHKGYSTPAHFTALSEYGPCQHHRRSFAPIRKRLEPAPDAEATFWDDDQISVAAP
jgi:ribonuclease HII